MWKIKETLARLGLRSSSKSQPAPDPSGKQQKPANRKESTTIARSNSRSVSSLAKRSTAELPLRPHDSPLRPHDNLPGRRDEEPFGPVVYYGENNNEPEGVDVVLVHDYQGHRRTSWTKSGVFWPSDLLSGDMPDVRIISWGWADPVIPNEQALTQMAEQSTLGDMLLGDIVAERKSRASNSTSRRIVFVAHGFGGIIVKQALSAAAMSRIYGAGLHFDMGDIFAQTAGVIFLGTVHVAISSQTVGQTIASAVQAVAHRPPDPLFLTWLMQNSDVFDKMGNDFTLFTRDLPVVCVREEYPTKQGQIIPKAASSYKGSLKIAVDSIRADHFDMARFSRRTDPGYYQLLGHISKLSQGPSPSDIQEVQTVRSQEILDTLYFDGMTEREERIEIDQIHQDSCAEILSAKARGETESAFHSWLTSKRDSLFWMSGKAGSGKSTLMKYAFQDKETQRRLKEWAQGCRLMTASVYLFEGGTQLQRSHETILRTILYQILSANKELIPIAFPGFFHGAWPPPVAFNSRVNLTQAFWSIFSHESTRLRLVIFLDGMDEYRCQEREGFYDDESEAGSSSRSGDENDKDESGLGASKWLEDSHREIAGFVNFMSDRAPKFCVSSRELVVFEEAFRGVPRLRVHNSSEMAIARYCSERLAADAPYLADANSLCMEVASKSNGGILWARLAMDILLEGSMRAIKPTLTALPTRLGGSRGLYMHIIQSLGPGEQRQVARIFQIMTRAQQPPSLLVIAFALSGILDADGKLHAVHDRLDPLKRVDLKGISERMQQQLSAWCPQFIQCEGEPLESGQRTVFVHQTVKEFAGRKEVRVKMLGGGLRTSPAENGTDIELVLLSSYVRNIRCFNILKSFIKSWSNNKIRISPEAWLLVSNALRCAAKIDKDTTDESPHRRHYLQLLSELDDACQDAWSHSLQSHRPLFEDPAWVDEKCPALRDKHWAGFEPMDGGSKSPKRTDFLDLALQANLVYYVKCRLQRFSDEYNDDDDSGRRLKLQQLLQYAVSPQVDNDGVPSCVALTGDYKAFHCNMPETAFVGMLLRQGASISNSAGSKTWVKAVKCGKHFFTRRDVTSVQVAGSSAASALMQNRERWVAAVKTLLSNGADPFAVVHVGAGSGASDDGSSSIDAKPASEVVRNTLQGEPEYTVEVMQMEALMERASLENKG